MISLKEIAKLGEALPKCGIQAAESENYCWIVDRKGEKVGSIHFNEGIVSIFESYEYADQVRQAIGEEKFETDYGETLYQQP